MRVIQSDNFLPMAPIFTTLSLFHNVMWVLISYLDQWSQFQKFPVGFYHNNRFTLSVKDPVWRLL